MWDLPGTLPLWLNPVCMGAAKGAAEMNSLFSSRAADLEERHSWGKLPALSQDYTVSLELGCEHDLGASN